MFFYIITGEYESHLIRQIRKQSNPDTQASSSASPISQDLSSRDRVRDDDPWKDGSNFPDTVTLGRTTTTDYSEDALTLGRVVATDYSQDTVTLGRIVTAPVYSQDAVTLGRIPASTVIPSPAQPTSLNDDTSIVPDVSTKDNSISMSELRNVFLKLEENMEREISETVLRYRRKKAPIVEAIIAKGGQIPASSMR